MSLRALEFSSTLLPRYSLPQRRCSCLYLDKESFPLMTKMTSTSTYLIKDTASSLRRHAFVKRGCHGAVCSAWKSGLLRIYCS